MTRHLIRESMKDKRFGKETEKKKKKVNGSVAKNENIMKTQNTSQGHEIWDWNDNDRLSEKILFLIFFLYIVVSLMGKYELIHSTHFVFVYRISYMNSRARDKFEAVQVCESSFVPRLWQAWIISFLCFIIHYSNSTERYLDSPAKDLSFLRVFHERMDDLTTTDQIGVKRFHFRIQNFFFFPFLSHNSISYSNFDWRV